MKKIKISDSIVCYNSHKYNSWWKLRDFIDWKELNKLIKKVEKSINSSCIFVLWWDWTILKSIRQTYKNNIPVLWINFWTKWFLLNSLEDINECTEFLSVKYPLIECTIKTKKEKISRIAFNEIDIRADTWKVLDLDIILQRKGEKKLKVNLKWDWFIFSTPAWTTGYNYSLGWPIIPHSLETFVLTPKAPLSPRNFRSIILEHDREIIVENVWRLSDIKIICDGSNFFDTKDEKIIISMKKSKNNIEFLFPKNWNNSLKDKIFLEQGFEFLK
jgi:NAD kinase